jgi:hypothetical protein
VTAWPLNTARTYRWAPAAHWLVLLARGWRLEDVDQRYFSVLLSRENYLDCSAVKA